MKNKPVIYISNYPFARADQEPLQALEKTGWQILRNPENRKLTPEELAGYAKDCDGIVAGTENLLPLVQAAPHLKIISRIGIGLDGVPLALCREKGIAVSYTPDAVTSAVSEFTIGLMIGIARQISLADRELREEKWSRPFGPGLRGSTVGLVGFGRVGSQVASLLRAFEPSRVMACDIKPPEKLEPAFSTLRREGLNLTLASLGEILESCDFISLHVPLSGATRSLIGAEQIYKMKKTAFCINTARGGIIDEQALFQALKENRIAGAAIDVFDHEPYRGNLAELGNILITQHMGSCTYQARRDMEMGAVLEVIRFFKGEARQTPVTEEEYAYQNQSGDWAGL